MMQSHVFIKRNLFSVCKMIVPNVYSDSGVIKQLYDRGINCHLCMFLRFIVEVSFRGVGCRLLGSVECCESGYIV